eukprot:5064408-Pleurochrysis_carterae.AAC.1
MSEPDVAMPQRRFEGRGAGGFSDCAQRSQGHGRARGRKGGGVKGSAAIQSAVIDACGLGLGKAQCCRRRGSDGEGCGEYGMGRRAGRLGQSGVPIRRSSTAPPRPLAISALLPNSVALDCLGVLTPVEGGRGRREAPRLCVGALPASLHICSAASFEEAVEQRPAR